MVFEEGNSDADASLAVQMVEYTAYALLTNYSANAGVRQLIDDYDFYLFPIVNPDGVLIYDGHLIRNLLILSA